MSPDNFEQTGDDNHAEVGADIELTGWMRGNRNRIAIPDNCIVGARWR